jgi:hypothetical protein
MDNHSDTGDNSKPKKRLEYCEDNGTTTSTTRMGNKLQNDGSYPEFQKKKPPRAREND